MEFLVHFSRSVVRGTAHCAQVPLNLHLEQRDHHHAYCARRRPEQDPCREKPLVLERITTGITIYLMLRFAKHTACVPMTTGVCEVFQWFISSASVPYSVWQ